MRRVGARPALVRLHDIAAHDEDRHAVAPGVVHRHGGVLQADDAVARHRDRLAFDLGIALRQVDGDILMHTGDDFGFVAAVIDDGFVQAAVARSAVDRQIFDAERVQHIGHEVAASRPRLAAALERRPSISPAVRPGSRWQHPAP